MNGNATHYYYNEYTTGYYDGKTGYNIGTIGSKCNCHYHVTLHLGRIMLNKTDTNYLILNLKF